MDEVPNELGGPQQNLQPDRAADCDDHVLVVRVGYVGFSEPNRPRRGDQRLSRGEVFALHGDDERFEAKDEFGLRDTAGAGAGGEVARVVVEGIDEREDGSVQHALR
nr:hypothetical protein CFP56_28927 [Quercus suber]